MILITFIILNLVNIIDISTGTREQLQDEFNSAKTEYVHLLTICYGNRVILKLLYKAIDAMWLYGITVPGGRIPEDRKQAWIYLKEYFWLIPLL